MKRLVRPAVLLVAIGATSLGARRPIAGSPRAADTVDLVIAATTDVHGRVRGWDYASDRANPAQSLAAAATIVDSLRTAAPGRVVLVDAGDMLQGNPLDLVEARHAATAPASDVHGVIAAMNAMRYDAAAIGNHEFNFGLPLLDRAAAQASFPLLAANAARLDGGTAIRSYTIVERAGVRVALVGATTPGALVWDRDHLRGRIDLRDPVVELRRAVGDARKAGADVVLVMLHSGLDEPTSYDTAATGVGSENVAARVAREVRGIDAIVFGHSHKQVADTVIGGTFLMQPRNYATSVGVLHMRLTRDGNAPWRVVDRRGALVAAAGHAESPAVLAATKPANARTLAYSRQAIAATPVRWSGDSVRVADMPITDFVLETMRRAAGADLAANAAFTTEASLGPGRVTRAEVMRLYPYENTLRAVRVSGRDVRAFLEQSARYYRTYSPGDATPLVDPAVPGYNFDLLAGADYTLDVSRPVGQRVTRLTVRGRPVADADSFTLALNNYRQTGGGGFTMLASAPVVYDRGESIGELLVAEARKRGTLRPADYFVRNWELVPHAAAARAYAEMKAADAPAAAVAVRKDGAPPRRVAQRDVKPRRLRILATNDIHGALEPRPDAQGVMRGGIGPLAVAITRARAECAADCVSILLDGGDEFQGTPASNLAYGRPIVEAFRTLDLSASALGNHEFDWSVDTLRARIRQAPYAILGANVRYKDGRSVPWLRTDTIVVRGGLHIGVIGLATVETPTTTRAVNVQTLRFDALAPVADARARALRQRGADAIIIVAHSGAFCDARPGAVLPDTAAPNGCHGEIVDLARALTEKVDAIVSGHTHSAVNTVVNGVPIVQARSSGRALGVIDLALGDAAMPPRIEVRDVLADSSAHPPAAVDTIIRRALAAVAPLVGRRIAEIAEDMPRESDEQYALGNLLADAQRWAGKGDVAIMNNGGIRADLRRGTATYGSLFEIQPFGNTLYKMTVRGRDLRAYVEKLVGTARPRMHVSGLTVSFDPRRTLGSRILDAKLADGRPIVDDQLYTIVLNDFLATGGDGVDLGARAASVTPLNIVDLDAFIGYLGTMSGPVRAPTEVRFRASEGQP
jgi:2',3'-cyclic-nucleotide 2'-phosphodiesterase (5'-nucleotidase family)